MALMLCHLLVLCHLTDAPLLFNYVYLPVRDCMLVHNEAAEGGDSQLGNGHPVQQVT